MAGVIHPLIWELTDEAFASVRDYTVFSMPPDLYDALAAAFKTESDDGFPSLPQASLEQLIGWFAPDVAFVKRERLETEGRYTLQIYYLGHCDQETAIRDLLDAFQLWLAVSGPKDREAGFDDRVLDVVEVGENWSVHQLDPALEALPGCCVEPRDTKAFDIVTQAMAGCLAGQPVLLDGKNWGKLILSGIKGDPYFGRELILFPPEHAAGHSHEGYWSEVIRIAAMTSPESQRLRIVASLHVRNYAALTPQSRFTPLERRLDVFFRARGVPAGEFRHGEIPFRLFGSNDQNVRPRYSYRHGADLFKAVRGFPGGADIDADAVPFRPIYGDGGLWMMPRLGRAFGDRDLPAGHGMGWTDREAFASHLDKLFSSGGLERINDLERTSPGRGFSIASPWPAPSRPKDENARNRSQFKADLRSRQHRRRKLVMRALDGAPLRLALFRMRDEAEGELHESLKELFGTPKEKRPGILQFEDGLVVNIQIEKSGILSEALPARPELTPAVAARTNKKKHAEIIRHQHRRLLDDHEEKLQTYAANVVSAWRDGKAWLALIEMPEVLRDKKDDPYTRVYRSIAATGGLPQAILVDSKGNASEYKIPHGLRDGLRMLGVAGLDEIKSRSRDIVPGKIRLVGLWTVRRNRDVRANETRGAHTFPLVIMDDLGVLKVALPNPDERGWAWVSYAAASVRIGAGQVPTYAKHRNAQRRDSFSQFYREVVESLAIEGSETVVMVEAANVRRELTSMSNRGLRLGVFEIQGMPGMQPLQIKDAETSVSVLRLNSDTSKRATYCRSGAKGHVSGTFREPGRTRTYWAVRPPALSLSGNWDLKAVMLASRRAVSHPDHQLRKSDEEYLNHDRMAPILEEVVVVARSRSFEFNALATLIRKLQLAHVSWSSATVLPYPLHEASRLENHLK
jgi:hypothetical protein